MLRALWLKLKWDIGDLPTINTSNLENIALARLIEDNNIRKVY